MEAARLVLPGPDPGDAKSLPTSYVLIEDVIPQDREIFLGQLDDVMGETGNYTLEVVHVTPFGTEILDRFHPIQVSRGVRGPTPATEPSR